MSLISTLEHFLEQHQLRDVPLVIGLSGGIDSVVLLDMLIHSTCNNDNLVAVHINHGLSSHALQWQVFCESLCADYGIDFFSEKVTLTDRHLGIEGAARKARYDALSTYLTPRSVLLTAQHQDDQAETLLLALKRGSGVLGIAGMQAISQLATGRQARPLLSVSQQQINHYALSQQLSWVEDNSNQDTRFDRNFLRHNVIGELSQRWPSFSANAARTAELCQEQMRLADEIAGADLATFSTVKTQLSMAMFNELSEVRINNLIRYWLRINRVVLPSLKQFNQLKKQLFSNNNEANPIIELGAHHIRRYHGCLYITVPSPQPLSAIIVSDKRLPLQLPLSLGSIEFNPLKPMYRVKAPRANQQVSIEFGLAGSTKAWPSERGQRRTLKKLWQEYNVPPWLRSQIPCLCYDGVLVAAIGYWLETQFIIGCAPSDDNSTVLSFSLKSAG